MKKISTSGPTFLVGDIGGTRTRLAVYRSTSRTPLVEAVLPSQEHRSFDDAVERFLTESSAPHPSSAVFGIAGPVRDGAATVTNLPWKLEERALARRLRIPRVVLVNDLVVGARGCLTMPPSAMITLTPERPAKKGRHIGIIAAGTGLGEARLLWVDGRYHALATEGGHCDFAPRTPLEVEFFQFLAGRFPDHVSYERVICGAGLGNLYDFFAARSKREPTSITRRLAQDDRNAAIAELGLAREYEPAARAVDLFASFYGAEAGNLVLRELAVGGIYVIGNIGRNIVPARRELFLEAFRRKGRFAGLLSSVPVAVMTDPLVGIRGALSIAREVVEDSG
jgi:glucokinase